MAPSGMTGEQIYQNFYGGTGDDGRGLTASADGIAVVSRAYADRASSIQKLVARMETAWQGEAAGAAQRGAGPLAVEHLVAAQEIDRTNGAINDQVNAFSTAKSTVTMVPPTPEKPGLFDNVITLGEAGENYENQLGRVNAANDTNVAAMTAYEADSEAARARMPEFTSNLKDDQSKVGIVEPTPPPPGKQVRPPPPTRRQPVGTGSRPPGANVPPGPGGGPPPGPAGGGPPQFTTPGQAGGPGPGGPGPFGPGPFGPGGPGPGGQGGPGPGGPPGPFGPVGPFGPGGGGGPGGSGGPGGVRGFGPGGPGFGPNGSGPGGSGPGGAGPGAGGAGARGAGGFGPGGPGAGGAAAEGGAGARGAAGGGVAAGAGRGGAAGGMGMGGGRGQGGDDAEHERPTYLVEPDPHETFGSDEITAPPVIGE